MFRVHRDIRNTATIPKHNRSINRKIKALFIISFERSFKPPATRSLYTLNYTTPSNTVSPE